ncbi:MAG: hypothetical protein BJ554DRAFT_4417 [Olpidium bornovanus]|uniref:Uncharacterized protein n=1 Tax=Olpidium bornovanus TaxID=278681 RepID=A0A8H8A0C1_9FUNG|nr:MAG: hypothetical protein BJ554DRAFT_4417 [Olpidium bornovanus]
MLSSPSLTSSAHSSTTSSNSSYPRSTGSPSSSSSRPPRLGGKGGGGGARSPSRRRPSRRGNAAPPAGVVGANLSCRAGGSVRRDGSEAEPASGSRGLWAILLVHKARRARLQRSIRRKHVSC